MYSVVGATEMDPAAHPAISEYTRFTLSITQEVNGHCTWRLKGKEQQDQWHELRTVASGSFTLHEPILDSDNVAGVLMGLLQREFSVWGALVE